MALNELGIAKRNLKRAQLLCRHIVAHVSPIYDQHVDDHPAFADRLVMAAQTAEELEKFLASIHEELCIM